MNKGLLKYRPDIDGLRAFAVLSVVFFHAFPTVLHGGFVGVDVFFVISGYLISGILIGKLEAGTFSLWDFYDRRIRRIFPALIVVLTFCLISGYIVFFDSEYAVLGKHVFSGAGFISNLVLWREVGYFDSASELKPLLHLWSLGVEEQFYIFWPLVMFFSWKRAYNLSTVIWSFILISLAISLSTVLHHKAFAFYSPLTRMWELLLGALLAYQNSQKTSETDVSTRGWLNELMGGIGFGLLILSVFILDKNKLFPGLWALLPTIGAVLVISSAGSFINRNIFSHRLMVSVGLISYPLYLWHWPLLSYAHVVARDVSIGWLCTLLVLSFLLATMTYQWVEKPFRFGKSFPKLRPLTLCASLFIVSSLGLYVYVSHGIPTREGFQELVDARNNQPSFLSYKENVLPCNLNMVGTQALTWCIQSKKGKPKFALLGDSHAEHLFPGLLAQDKENNWVMVGHTGCPPLQGVEVFQKGTVDVCAKSNALSLKALLNTPSIETVVLASSGAFYISDIGFAPEHVGEYSPKNWQVSLQKKDAALVAKKDVFYQGMDDTITALEAHGKQVILYRDVPEVSFVSKDCLNRPLGTGQDHTLTFNN